MNSTRLRTALSLVVALGVGGCLSSALEDAIWHTVETPHFRVLSALGARETERLAIEVERFRAAAEFVWGRALPATATPTTVYAFDDRGRGRPFVRDARRSYLVERLDGDLVVLRTGGGWNGDARTPLRAELARRWFANDAGGAKPPWLAEGLAQLASTIDVRGVGATVGRPHDDHVRTLRTRQWLPLERVLGARDLVGWSHREREIFGAEAWALAHYLRLAPGRRAHANATLAALRKRVAAGEAPSQAASALLGDAIQREVYPYVSAPELPSLSVAITHRGLGPAPRTLAAPDVRIALGELALAIGEVERARRDFESALELAPGAARAHAGLGDVLATREEPDAAAMSYRRALAAAPDDLRVRLGWARRLLDRAVATRDAGQRARLVAAARDELRDAERLAPEAPAVAAEKAAALGLDGDPRAGLAALAPALARLPADATLGRLAVELALAAGDRAEARRHAARLVTLAGDRAALDAARSLLERSGGR